MPISRKSSPTVVLDPALAEETDTVNSLECTDDVEYPDEAASCPTCGELLAWHEQPCSASTAPVLSVQDEVRQGSTVSSFTYAIGQPVQPVPATQVGKVIWRGQVKERHPRTGLLHRVNVYRLDNGYWDCYYEAELQAA